MQRRQEVDADPYLLKEATKVAGEDSPSAVVDKALSELVRIARLKRGIQAMKDTSDMFWPNYLEELRPNSWAAYEKRKASYEGREVASAHLAGERKRQLGCRAVPASHQS